MNRYFTINAINDHFVVVKFHPVNPTKMEFDEYLKECERLVFKKNVILVYDISEAKFLSAEQRIAIGELMKRTSSLVKANWLGIVYVNSSVVASLMLKGILLISSPPVPYKIVPSMDKAIIFGETLLQKV